MTTSKDYSISKASTYDASATGWVVEFGASGDPDVRRGEDYRWGPFNTKREAQEFARRVMVSEHDADYEYRRMISEAKYG